MLDFITENAEKLKIWFEDLDFQEILEVCQELSREEIERLLASLDA